MVPNQSERQSHRISINVWIWTQSTCMVIACIRLSSWWNSNKVVKFFFPTELHDFLSLFFSSENIYTDFHNRERINFPGCMLLMQLYLLVPKQKWRWYVSASNIKVELAELTFVSVIYLNAYYYILKQKASTMFDACMHVHVYECVLFPFDLTLLHLLMELLSICIVWLLSTVCVPPFRFPVFFVCPFFIQKLFVCNFPAEFHRIPTSALARKKWTKKANCSVAKMECFSQLFFR